jgi:hypothetical protein
VLLAGRDLSACSQVWGLEAEKHLGPKAVLPRSAEFHVWMPSTPEVEIDLLDARSRPVPVAVEVFAAAQSIYYMLPLAKQRRRSGKGSSAALTCAPSVRTRNDNP